MPWGQSWCQATVHTTKGKEATLDIGWLTPLDSDKPLKTLVGELMPRPPSSPSILAGAICTGSDGQHYAVIEVRELTASVKQVIKNSGSGWTMQSTAYSVGLSTLTPIGECWFDDDIPF